MALRTEHTGRRSNCLSWLDRPRVRSAGRLRHNPAPAGDSDQPAVGRRDVASAAFRPSRISQSGRAHQFRTPMCQTSTSLPATAEAGESAAPIHTGNMYNATPVDRWIRAETLRPSVITDACWSNLPSRRRPRAPGMNPHAHDCISSRTSSMFRGHVPAHDTRLRATSQRRPRIGRRPKSLSRQ